MTTSSFQRRKFDAVQQRSVRAVALNWPAPQLAAIVCFNQVWEAAGFHIMDLYSFLKRQFRMSSTLFLKLSPSKRTRK